MDPSKTRGEKRDGEVKGVHGMPLIFYHTGDSYYLSYCLQQAIFSNPGAAVILLGDESNVKYAVNGVQHYMAKNYWQAASTFEKNFVNMSTQPAVAELRCFQRWYVVDEFLQKESITGPFACFDTDVMLYDDVNAFYRNTLYAYDLSPHGNLALGYNYFKDASILKIILHEMDACYGTPEGLQRLKAYRREGQKTKDGVFSINDITMFDLARMDHDLCVIDLREIVDGATCDTHLSKTNDTRFVMEHGRKKIILRDHQPYCAQTETSGLIRMRMLHFQGFYKRYMFLYYTGDPKCVAPKWRGYYQLAFNVAKRKLWRILHTRELKQMGKR